MTQTEFAHYKKPNDGMAVRRVTEGFHDYLQAIIRRLPRREAA